MAAFAKSDGNGPALPLARLSALDQPRPLTPPIGLGLFYGRGLVSVAPRKMAGRFRSQGKGPL
jgi:hypothetical protein